jgi:hypothetical protein
MDFTNCGKQIDVEPSDTQASETLSAGFIDESGMRSHRDVQAAVAVSENFLEIRPMKGLTTFEENMEEFLGDELVDKCFPLFRRELGPFASAAISIAELAIHIASLSDAHGQFERLVEFGNL